MQDTAHLVWWSRLRVVPYFEADEEGARGQQQGGGAIYTRTRWLVLAALVTGEELMGWPAAAFSSDYFAAHCRRTRTWRQQQGGRDMYTRLLVLYSHCRVPKCRKRAG